MVNNGEKDVLLKMHQFYAEEARNQRSMMWETVKWFTPALLAIHGAWGLIYTNASLGLSKQEVCALLLVISIGGMVFSYICIRILGNFDRTNFIYISMFAKIEDELDFDIAGKKKKELLF